MNISDIKDTKNSMIVVADANFFPHNAYECAKSMAKSFTKEIAILVFTNKNDNKSTIEARWNQWLDEEKQKDNYLPTLLWIMDCDNSKLNTIVEETESVMLFFETNGDGVYSKTKNVLKICRELRVPYVLTKKNDNLNYTFNKILVPVTFLVEDKEKGPYSANMGRFANSEITLMKAKDYGTKAEKNTESIRLLYDKFNLKYDFKEAKKDSFAVEKEAIQIANNENYDMVIISASREYGMDDIFFGPKELHAYNQTKHVPVMMINPRADLYVLCW